MTRAGRGRHVALRADASQVIGHGHVMRCLTLADALQLRGAECTFVCRPHEGHLANAIAARGHGVRLLTEPSRPDQWLGEDWGVDAEETIDALETLHPDWLVVDHYAIDAAWESRVSGLARRIAVIDDLADRNHACDLLLDQTAGRDEADYVARVPSVCRLLVGARYALVRPEFAFLRDASIARRRRSHALRRVAVSVGGVDRDDVSGRVLDALASVERPLSIVVLVSGSAPHVEALKARASRMPHPTRILVDAPNFARELADADVAIGAAGSTAWERCTLGLPTLMLILADNQREVAQGLEAEGAALLVGEARDIDDRLVLAVRRLMETPGLLSSMGTAAAGVTDGLGAARVADAMETME